MSPALHLLLPYTAPYQSISPSTCHPPPILSYHCTGCCPTLLPISPFLPPLVILLLSYPITALVVVLHCSLSVHFSLHLSSSSYPILSLHWLLSYTAPYQSISPSTCHPPPILSYHCTGCCPILLPISPFLPPLVILLLSYPITALVVVLHCSLSVPFSPHLSSSSYPILSYHCTGCCPILLPISPFLPPLVILLLSYHILSYHCTGCCHILLPISPFLPPLVIFLLSYPIISYHCTGCCPILLPISPFLPPLVIVLLLFLFRYLYLIMVNRHLILIGNQS